MSTQPAEPDKPEPPRRGLWMTKRFLIAAVGVVLLSGGASAVLALNEVGKIADALGQNKAIKIAPHVLATASTGAPETLLLVGNDQRPPPKDNPRGFVLPHSNEMLLVRIDPSKPTIAMMSIPRELQVPIYPPGAPPVLTRINAALAFGGIELMTKTIERVLGIPINHVFVVTFPKFRRAVDEMGCVYMTVDRRYYHRNEPGGEQYFEIDLQPGYQRMCGEQALEFVANRHEDTSLNRDARDQRFLLEVKAQFGATLFENREKFEHIFGKAVETDLHGTGSVLDLLRLLVASAGKPVRQVHFQVNLLPTFDTATPQQLQESVQSFLSATSSIHTHHVSAPPRSTHHGHHAPAPSLGLTPTTSEELDQARSQSPRLPFPLEYPRARQAFAGAVPDLLRVYAIRDPGGRVHPAYVISIAQGPLGQFYDVQGTTWANPPLLNNPTQEVRVGRRMYGLFYSGEQIRVVAWHEGDAVYWIENTLANSLSPRVMLAIAAETTPVIPIPGAPTPTRAAPPAAFELPARATAGAGTPEQIGAVLGLIGLAVVAALSVLLLSRQRQVNVLREQVVAAMQMESVQRPLLASSGLVAVEAAAPVARATVPAAPRVPVGVEAGSGAVAGGESAPPLPPPLPTPLRAADGTVGGTKAAPPGAPPAVAAAATGEHDEAGPTIYRARRRWRGGALAAGALLVAAVAAGAYVASRPSSPSASERSGYGLPVSVFNASGSPGAAHRVAGVLRAGRVPVGEVGNINSKLGPGAFVLYPPGARAEAGRVARLLSGRPATVTPIQPQVQSAIGRSQEIVVVLD